MDFSSCFFLLIFGLIANGLPKKIG